MNETNTKTGLVRRNICLGDTVDIIQKRDQRTGKLTRGVVKNILTNSPSHPHGIKVRLQTGQVGRVQAIIKVTKWQILSISCNISISLYPLILKLNTHHLFRVYDSFPSFIRSQSIVISQLISVLIQFHKSSIRRCKTKYAQTKKPPSLEQANLIRTKGLPKVSGAEVAQREAYVRFRDHERDWR